MRIKTKVKIKIIVIVSIRAVNLFVGDEREATISNVSFVVYRYHRYQVVVLVLLLEGIVSLQFPCRK